jgi:transposase
MSATPPIPQELWDEVPPAAQAAVLALVQSLERRIAALEARLGQDSSNSSKPPSSDPIHLKRRPPRPPSGKRRCGQRGHKRQTRELVPPDRLTAAVECRPSACRGCGHRLTGTDPEPLGHQVAELPEVRPDVTEYRLHRLVCPRCGRDLVPELIRSTLSSRIIFLLGVMLSTWGTWNFWKERQL